MYMSHTFITNLSHRTFNFKVQPHDRYSLFLLYQESPLESSFVLKSNTDNNYAINVLYTITQ